ncbi:response regulator transcription factor [Streptomyces sp. NPDC001714]|uniref:response regulator transcription factor n=1 Tax=Streptomyces sp. NPDC001714 TaxID=3364603 RepID=UPI00369DD066
MTPPSATAESRYRLLVVEDEPSIRTLLESTLRLAGGYEVSGADSGQSALVEVERVQPHLMLLDVMLPDLDGFEVTRRLRAAGNDVPVLFLTARTGVDDRIKGLAAGGDDYVAKPFNIEEVLLRIEAILRRTAGDPEPPAPVGVLRYADVELDELAHEVHRAGQYVALSPTEFRLLRYLLVNAGQVVSKTQIVDHVWSYDFAGDQRIIETYVKYLRRKIDRFDPPLIHTVRGIGYCLRLPRDHQEASES